ncbi:MAG: uracil-xanthine permease [Clostridia bacterium]|nr:uracil-xanthine permease [Clostridia bacterium]
MSKPKKAVGDKPIYDSFKELGTGRTLILGFQHTFAMFGATVLVPLLTGLNIQTTLLMAGLGTLLFHLLTKMKVPAFLGSSFAFLGGYAAVKELAGEDPAAQAKMLPYACLGVAAAGLVYLVLALLFKIFDVRKVMKFFPPIVTGPIIIAIGLILAPSAIGNAQTNWLLAVIAIAVVAVCNIWGKGMAKIVPILLGIIVSVVAAVVMQLCGMEVFDPAKLDALKEASWIGLPIMKENIVFGNTSDKNLIISAIIICVPISLATMMEHIGDISAISATTGKNFIADPGLHRTLIGDGLATTLSSLFGGPANTTYGENTGVLALTKVYDPKVVRIAAGVAIVLSFSPKIAAFINLIPTAVIGGISLILYGMISAIGIRNLVENKVDLTKSRNTIIAAVILVLALGLTAGITFTIGSVTVTLSALAVAALAGILLNAIFPGKDYDFDAGEYTNSKNPKKEEKAEKAAE